MEFIEVPAFTSRVLRYLGENRYADLQDLLKDKYPYRYVVVIGRKMDDGIIDAIADGESANVVNNYVALQTIFR